MYPRFAFALLFSFAAFGLGIAIPAFPTEKCGANAEFRTCGLACVPTCANPEQPKACMLQCVKGCFCKDGFLKNDNGECVRPQDCQATLPKIPMQKPSTIPICPINEEFQSCGSACAPTCANPNPSKVCTKQCVVGCFCKQGQLRNSRGVCVAADKCDATTKTLMMLPPPVCKNNEEYRTCGSACPATCANPTPICTKNCMIGCFCKEGYLKNEMGECVPAANCAAPSKTEPKCTKDHEMFVNSDDCGTQMDCMASCGTPPPFLIHGYPQVPKKCLKIKCAASCVCTYPYVRNTDGQCVERKDCAPTTSH